MLKSVAHIDIHGTYVPYIKMRLEIRSDFNFSYNNKPVLGRLPMHAKYNVAYIPRCLGSRVSDVLSIASWVVVITVVVVTGAFRCIDPRHHAPHVCVHAYMHTAPCAQRGGLAHTSTKQGERMSNDDWSLQWPMGPRLLVR